MRCLTPGKEALLGRADILSLSYRSGNIFIMRLNRQNAELNSRNNLKSSASISCPALSGIVENTVNGKNHRFKMLNTLLKVD